MVGVVKFAVESAAIDENPDNEDIRNRASFMEKFKYIGFNDPFPEKLAASQPKPSINAVKLKKDLYPPFKM